MTGKHTSRRKAPIAKISRPHISGILPRKRLFDIIDRSRKFPVIFITSPPGAGKTSLIASYLENRKIPCLWYSIDGGDADIATFFHYMRLAAQYSSPQNKQPLPSYSSDYAHGAGMFCSSPFPHWAILGQWQAAQTIARHGQGLLLAGLRPSSPNASGLSVVGRGSTEAEVERLVKRSFNAAR